MAKRTAKLTALLVACALVVTSAQGLAAAAGRVSIDAKDAKLDLILQLMAAQGAAKLAAHPDMADEPLTFATKQMSRTAAVRWLCRACRLTVARGSDGASVVGKPSIDKGLVKQYKIAGLVANELEAEGLVSFIREVLFAAFLNREEGDDGKLVPRADAKCEKDRLKVLAPGVVQKEVLALLQAMSRAKERGDVEQLAVKYSAYDLGLFRAGTGAEPPSLKGTVTLDLQGAAAAEAAWELTSKSEVSFYIDPWDPALAETKVSLSVQDAPIASAARKLAEALGAEAIQYDGAWLFVRGPRQPLYDGLVVRVYNVAGESHGRAIAETVLRRAKALKLPRGLPYAIERVGDRLLASMPATLHQRLEEIVKAHTPRAPEEQDDRPRGPRHGRGRPSGRGRGRGKGR